MIVCTIAAENYLHKAFALAESLRVHEDGVRLAICVPERQIHQAVTDSRLFDVAFTLEELVDRRRIRAVVPHRMSMRRPDLQQLLLRLLTCCAERSDARAIWPRHQAG